MIEKGEPEVQAALLELQQYLSDRIPPLMVADALEVLMGHPSALAAREILSWTAGQYEAGTNRVPLADYFFHALTKIHRVGELQLVQAPALAGFLAEVTDVVLESCPDEDRDLLRANVQRLGAAALSAPVPLLHRQPEAHADSPAPTLAALRNAPAAAAPPAIDVSPEVARSLRRLNALLDRLARVPQAAESASTGAARQALVSEAFSSAAASSESGRQLDLYLQELKQHGLPAQTDKIFHILAESLSPWTLPRAQAEGRRRLGGPALAMFRLVSLAPDATESTRRFRELVHSAIRQFNEGLIARTAAILGVAERLEEEKHVPAAAAAAARQGAHGFLDQDRLRRYAESPEKHELLRRVLAFFTPLSPEALLNELSKEERHDARRALLSLLEAYGPAGRTAALARLQSALADASEPDPFYLRNLIYLLRIVPRPEDQPPEPEVDAIVRAARPGRHPALVKEAVNCLGKLGGGAAETALLGFLKQFEGMLLKPETALFSRDEILQLLDRTTATLARLGTHNGVRAVIEHGMKDQAELGETRARLAELGMQDLSPDPEVVAYLIAAIRAELPRGMMARLINKKKLAPLAHFVTALSGTATAEAQALFGELASRFPGEALGQAATKALAGAATAAKAPDSISLSGDLELFGLPTLLQNLADIHAGGTLTIFDTGGTLVSLLSLDRGRLLSCQSGPLRGPEAFWQLFERPQPGRFAFAGQRDAARQDENVEALEITRLILEGLRRYDELRQASLLVPDGAPLQATGQPASPHAEESNEALVEAVWERVVEGGTPLDCEAEVPVDAYRVRRLLAHWVEQGALSVG